MLHALPPDRRRRARMVAVGARLPAGVLTNEDLAARMDTSERWIVSRTGIRERRVVRRDETTTDLAQAAAVRTLERAGAGAGQVDALIVATATPEHLMPSTACVVADRIGAGRAACFDLGAACSGFVYGLVQATGLIEAGLADRVLVVASEVFTRVTDYEDRTNAILWGDAAAGALMVAAGPEARGVLGFELGADGSGGGLITLAATTHAAAAQPNGASPGAADPTFVRMHGREVFRFATRTAVESIGRLLATCGLSVDDFGVIAFHQANLRIIEHAVEALGLPSERVLRDLVLHGNTAAASIPLALAAAADDGRLAPGGLLLLSAFGAGLTWGTMALAYEPDGAPPPAPAIDDGSAAG